MVGVRFALLPFAQGSHVGVRFALLPFAQGSHGWGRFALLPFAQGSHGWGRFALPPFAQGAHGLAAAASRPLSLFPLIRGCTPLYASPYGKGRCHEVTEGIRKSVNRDRQSLSHACACQLPLHKGAIIKNASPYSKGRCHKVTEGIRKPVNRDRQSLSHAAHASSLCTREPWWWGICRLLFFVQESRERGERKSGRAAHCCPLFA